MRFKSYVLKTLFLCLVLVLSIATPLFAVGSAGFENGSLSAKSLGRGNAFTADADDPSTVSINPAGMSQLDGVQVSGGFAGLNLITDYKAADGGVDTRSASKLKFAPNSYVTMKIPYLPLHFGFGMNAPFGLANQYSSTHPFRYIGYKNELIVAGYTFAGSLEITPKLSVGAGATYYDASLKQQFKINSTQITKSVIPFWPELPDADCRLKMEGDGWGWNLGALYKPFKKHSLGFMYRSRARLDFKGHLNVENIQGPVMQALFGGVYQGTPINTDIVLPPQATWAYKYQVKPNWDVEVDLGWTGWSVFDRQSFSFGLPNPVLLASTPIPQGYHDTFNVHVGSDWDVKKWLTLRGGYFFYQSPARNGNMGPVIPDSNRQGLAVGLGLKWRSITIDMTYIPEIFVQRKVADTSVGVASGVEADGKYTSFLNLFAFNITYRFDYPWESKKAEEKS